MRIVLWILMILGWWSAGLLLSSLVVRCSRIVAPSPPGGTEAAIIYPCPKLSYKCWIGSAVAVLNGLAWYWVMGLKGGYLSGGYLASVALSAILGATVARILCPK